MVGRRLRPLWAVQAATPGRALASLGMPGPGGDRGRPSTRTAANRRAPHPRGFSAQGRAFLLSFSLVNCVAAFVNNQPVANLRMAAVAAPVTPPPGPGALLAWAGSRHRLGSSPLPAAWWRDGHRPARTGECARMASSDASGANAAVGEADEAEIPVFDVPGLKKELTRQVQRQFKKVGKAEEKARKAQAQYELLDPASEEGLFKKADLIELREAAAEAVERLKRLNDLEEAIKSVKSVNNEKYPAIAKEAAALELTDTAPERPPRPEKKPKGPRPTPRKPYVTYTSSDGIEIRVGRGAADNDELTLKLRDGRDWWMHVSGHPGSHVVVRCTDEEPPKDTMLDAAALALKFSQAGGGTQPVSVTRCRDISKPSGLKAGQVRLTGAVSTIKVNLKTEAARLERLLETRSTD